MFGKKCNVKRFIVTASVIIACLLHCILFEGVMCSLHVVSCVLHCILLGGVMYSLGTILCVLHCIPFGVSCIDCLLGVFHGNPFGLSCVSWSFVYVALYPICDIMRLHVCLYPIVA